MWFLKQKSTEAEKAKSSATTIKPPISSDFGAKALDKDILLEVPAVAVEVQKAD